MASSRLTTEQREGQERIHQGRREGHSCEIEIDNKDRPVLWEVQNAKKAFLWVKVILEVQILRKMEFLVNSGQWDNFRVTKGWDTTIAGTLMMTKEESGATLIIQMRPMVTALFQSAGTPG